MVTTASFAVKMNLSRTCWGIAVLTATISERNLKPVGKTFSLEVISQLILKIDQLSFSEDRQRPSRLLAASSRQWKASCLPAEPSGGRLSRMDNVNKEEISVEFQSGWKR